MPTSTLPLILWILFLGLGILALTRAYPHRYVTSLKTLTIASLLLLLAPLSSLLLEDPGFGMTRLTCEVLLKVLLLVGCLLASIGKPRGLNPYLISSCVGLAATLTTEQTDLSAQVFICLVIFGGYIISRGLNAGLRSEERYPHSPLLRLLTLIALVLWLGNICGIAIFGSSMILPAPWLGLTPWDPAAYLLLVSSMATTILHGTAVVLALKSPTGRRTILPAHLLGLCLALFTSLIWGMIMGYFLWYFG